MAIAALRPCREAPCTVDYRAIRCHLHFMSGTWRGAILSSIAAQRPSLTLSAGTDLK